MLKGTIYITYDVNLCLANLGTCKTIAIVDEPDILNIPGKIGGSILLPPYEALAALVDNNYNEFEYLYIQYLSMNQSVVKFIDIILQALIVGTNIIFLIDSDGPKFDDVLRKLFMNSFGICIGDDKISFQYNINALPMIFTRLYANDSINAEYFLRLYPQDAQFDQFTIRKLAYDYKIPFTTDSEMNTYFKHHSIILKGGMIQDVVLRLES